VQLILYHRETPNLADFQISFTGRFVSKCAAQWLLKIPPHLKYVTSLLCEIYLLKNWHVQEKYENNSAKKSKQNTEGYFLSKGKETEGTCKRVK